MTQTLMISSQLDYVVTLLEGLVGRQETTETKVAKIDERTAHLTPQHAHDVREMVDRIVQEIDRRSPGRPPTYAPVPCGNRKASSSREREDVSRSRGHYGNFSPE